MHQKAWWFKNTRLHQFDLRMGELGEAWEDVDYVSWLCQTIRILQAEQEKSEFNWMKTSKHLSKARVHWVNVARFGWFENMLSNLD